MWNILRALSNNLLLHAEQSILPKRTVFILKRKHPVRLNKLLPVFRKRLKKRDYYYELVEDTNVKRKTPVDLVLTSDVAGLGMRGDRIQMNVYIAYRDLLLPKLAVYADSPEAKSLGAVESRQYSSIYSKIVENYLAEQAVQIILSHDIKWTLKPWHVKVALRKNGIFLNEDCITIPREINGPDKEIENKDFIVNITMNKSEVFTVRCRIYHWSVSDPMLNHKSLDVNSPSAALFPEEKEEIDAIIKTAQEIKRARMLQEGKNKKSR